MHTATSGGVDQSNNGKKRNLPELIAARIVADYVDDGAASDRLPAMRELQKKYNTSHITIVGALNLLARDGAIDKRQGSGCFISSRKAAANSVGSKVIAFVTPDESELMIRLYNGIEQVCHANGYNLLIANSRHDYVCERQRVSELIDCGCKGIIMEPVTRTREEIETDYLSHEALSFPIVAVDIAYPGQRRSQIVFDNYQAGYGITELLIRKGHRRIAFMLAGGEATSLDGPLYLHRSTLDRLDGYRDAMANAGLGPLPEDCWALSTHWRGQEFVQAVLPHLRRLREAPAGDRPTAVIAIEDESAVYTMQLAQQLGMRPGVDLSVAGFDDLAIGRSAHPAFPTAVPDFRAAGRIAAQLILRQIRGQISLDPQTHVLPVEIKERECYLNADEPAPSSMTERLLEQV